MTSLGFTADQDNARLDPKLVETAVAEMDLHIAWDPAGPKEQVLLNSFDDLRGLADRVLLIAHTRGKSYWVLQSDWSGFPDPSEFILVGFCDQGEVNALGYFEDWPSAWSHPEAL